MKRTYILLSILGLAVMGSGVLLSSSSNPAPLINQPLVPAAVAPGGAGFTLTVNGTGFVPGATVNWDSTPLTTTFVSGSQLTAAIPAANVAATSTASITVVNPAPGGGASNAVFFEVTSPAPSVGASGSAVATASGPISVAVGDFNGDGKLDLLTGDPVSGDVSVLLGNGDGTFQSAVEYTVGPGVSQFDAYQLAAADFNGDGKLDFVVANENANNVSVFLGKGDGTFQPGVNYDAGTSPTSVAVADLNGDGKLDLAVSNQSCPSGPPCPTATVSILLGNGDGTFQAHVDYPAGVDANWVTVGDFNGDGKLDLAVADGQGDCPGCESAFSILLGNGDGTFQAPVTSFGGTNPASIATADFNGDGKLDLVLVDNIGVFWFFLGNGDGTFQTATASLYFTSSFPFGEIGIADLNGDGKLDIAIAAPGSNVVDVYLGNGDGTFSTSPTSASVLVSTGSQPRGVAVGDFNQDGRLDLAVPNYLDNSVSVLLQGPTASLSQASLSFAAQAVTTSSAAQPLTLTNAGVGTLMVNGIAMSGANAADFIQTNTCNAPIAAGGSCTISVTFTPSTAAAESATLTITDNSMDASAGTQTVSLTGAGTDFALAPSITSTTVKAGGAATFTLSVTPEDGFNQTVSFNCTGAPSLSTCVPSPTSVTPNGTSAVTATVTFTTTAGTRVAPRGPVELPPLGDIPLRNLWVVSAGLLVLLVAATCRRRIVGAIHESPLRVPRLALALVLGTVLIWAACGGGSSVTHTPGTAPGTYTLTLTATAGGLSHSTTVAVTVTQ